MRIEYEPPRKKRQPVFACFKALLRIFIRKVRVVTQGGELGSPCLYLANHANKMGPMVYSMFFPEFHVKWGASQMFGNYGERYRYIRDVLYIQKNGSGRAVASFRAFFEAFFSAFVYCGMCLLPTYTDGRLAKTVKKSVALLGEGTSLMIFPENSEDGYKAEPTDFFPGFMLVAKGYGKTYGSDIPMRPVYYHKKKRLIVVGEACSLADFGAAKKEEVAEIMRGKVVELYRRIESGEFDSAK